MAATATSGAGIDVHGSRSGNHFLAGASIPSLQASNQFGTAIAQLDVNSDLCEDLAVGDPGRTGGGAVDLLFGSSAGIRTDDAVQIPARTPQDAYGDSVALDHRIRDGVQVTDLWVGAPDRTIDGALDAGAVDHYLIDASGHPQFVESITEASAIAHTEVHSGDRFGAVLDARSIEQEPAWVGGVFIGSPDATVAGHPAAGSVTWLATATSSDHVNIGQTFNQDSPGVPGASEAGDRFGAAVSDFVVGVPDEDLGSVRDAGLVQFFHFDFTDDLIAPSTAKTQNSACIPGTAEAGDRFGAAIIASVEQGAVNQGEVDAYVGSPGEDLAGLTNAGDVTELGADPGACGTLLRQGNGLPGSMGAQNRVGNALAFAVNPNAVADGMVPYRLQVGIPGQTIGSAPAAGEVFETEPSTVVGFSGGPIANLQYGLVLAHEGAG